MADVSLDDPASAGNPHLSSRIVFTHLMQGCAVVRVPVRPWLVHCKISFIHDYLWALNQAIERMLPTFDKEWEEKWRKQKDAKS